MNVGDVFVWHNYPYRKAGKIKDRWFIYLGTFKADPFSRSLSEVFVMIPTTTTQLHHYEPEGDRYSHSIVRFTPSQGFGFEAECVADFDAVFYDITLATFNKFRQEDDIEVRGRIDHEPTMKKINNAVQQARFIDRRIKRSITENLRTAGFDV